MRGRALPLVLVSVGASVVLGAAFIPYARSYGSSFSLLQTNSSAGFKYSVGYFIEPLLVAVGSVLVVALLGRRSRKLAGAALAALGGQTIALYLGYVLSPALSGGANELRAGGFVGMLGAALVLAGGLILVLVAPEAIQTAAAAPTMSAGASAAAPAAGWYGDPWDATCSRYWDGTRWTEHTQHVGPPPSPAAGPA